MDDYAADLARSARIALSHDPPVSSGFTPIPVLHAALGAYGDVAIVLALGAAAALSGGLRPRTALHGLFALAAGVAALTQDAAHPGAVPTALACMVRLAAESSVRSPVRRLAALALCLHLLPALFRQALAGVVFSMGASGGFPDFASGLPRMDGVWFGGAGVTVNTFGEERPQWRGSLDAMMWGRRSTYSHSHLSSSEMLFTWRSSVRLLLDAQGPRLAAEWCMAAENGHWRLLRRREIARQTAIEPRVRQSRRSASPSPRAAAKRPKSAGDGQRTGWDMCLPPLNG